ncbi:hypothetical protein [Nonomuraea fuscirosea]|uniref:hypothetical protein n=1 Tax=Nonomuraea fuscirosea TaxID=1291556 RepID=UPI00341547D2
MATESSGAVPPTDLGGESAVADADYDETRADVEVQETELVPVERPVTAFDPKQHRAPSGPIKLVAPTEPEANPEPGGGQR